MRPHAFLLLVLSFVIGRPRQVPAHELAKPAPPNAAARVSVSRFELRVVFPQDTATTWGWSDRRDPGYHAGYDWTISIDGIDGPERLSMIVSRREPRAQRWVSLDSLVASATSSFCPPGTIGYCPTSAASLSVSQGRVILSYRDSAKIARLFALRPPTAAISRWTPADSLPTGETVRVDYVAPEIPTPNAGTFAEAERARRAYERSVHSVIRSISGGPHDYSALWIALGDSVVETIDELRCHHDVCAGQTFGGRVTWSIDDIAVVATHVQVSDTSDPDSFSFPSRANGLVVKARRLGRTTLRAELAASASDSLPSRTPPSRSLVREVNVIPPVARIELRAPRRPAHAGELVELRARALDRAGRRIEVPLDLLFVGEMRMTAEANGRVPHVFEKAGVATVVASFGTKSDTLRLDILPR